MGITRSPENTLIELVGITSFKSVLQLAGDTANLRTGHLKWQESGTKSRATVKRTVALIDLADGLHTHHGITREKGAENLEKLQLE